jgi:DNA-binding NarL/FixJ family response regulator
LLIRISLNKNNMPITPIKICVATSNFLIRAGLSKLINTNMAFNNVGEASSVKELKQLLSVQKPQVVIMEYSNNSGFGLDELLKLNTKYKTIRFLVISSEINASELRKVIAIGIKNYILTNCTQTEITDALLACAMDKKYFCAQVIDTLLEQELTTITTPITEREQEIIQLILLGTRPKEIANVLNLSYHTVATHKRNIYKKLGVNSVMELAQMANNMGLSPSN